MASWLIAQSTTLLPSSLARRRVPVEVGAHTISVVEVADWNWWEAQSVAPGHIGGPWPIVSELVWDAGGSRGACSPGFAPASLEQCIAAARTGVVGGVPVCTDVDTHPDSVRPTGCWVDCSGVDSIDALASGNDEPRRVHFKSRTADTVLLAGAAAQAALAAGSPTARSAVKPPLLSLFWQLLDVPLLGSASAASAIVAQQEALDRSHGGISLDASPREVSEWASRVLAELGGFTTIAAAVEVGVVIETNGIDGHVLSVLDDIDLQELGLSAAHRTALLSASAHLRSDEPSSERDGEFEAPGDKSDVPGAALSTAASAVDVAFVCISSEIDDGALPDGATAIDEPVDDAEIEAEAGDDGDAENDAGSAAAGPSLLALFPLLSRIPSPVLQRGLPIAAAPFDALLRWELWAIRSLWALSPLWLRWLALPPLRWLWWLACTAIGKQALWTAVMMRAWRQSEVMLRLLFPDGDPLYIYRIPWRLSLLLWRLLRTVVDALLRVLHWALRQIIRALRALWWAYSQLLAAPQRWSKRAGSRGSEIMVMPLAFGWMGWPLALPPLLGATDATTLRTVWGCAALVVAVQVVVGRGIIQQAWYGR